MDLQFNKYQTELTDEIRKKYHKDVISDLNEFISSVTFIKHLISDNRGYAKNLPVMHYENDEEEIVPYEDGRKVINITKPHLLEDMDFFRERAIFFDKHGKYTDIRPSPNPNGEYARFWKEELRRWKHGYVRPSDGEWIPGGLYFYWNYYPIWLTGKQTNKSKRRAERVKKFPKPWLGDYLYFHYLEQAQTAGKHGKILKSRGVGFSFKMGSLSPRNMYVFPGEGNPNFHLASDKTFLTGDKGIWGKVLTGLDWIADHTPFPRMRLVDGKRAMELQLGYVDEFGVRKGNLASVFGISLKHDAQKARGIRGPLIHYEEDGLFPNLEDAWNVNRAATEDGGQTFGFMLAGGTGGTEGASFAGSEKLFYRPNAYGIYSIPNVFDKNINGQTECGFFWGAYMNRNGCYDESNGEPDVIKALLEILDERVTIKYSSSDPRAVTQKKAEIPITPQEAVMRTSGTLFPVADLKEYISTIEPIKDRFCSSHYIGDLIYTGGKVEYNPNGDKYPIRAYPPEDSLRLNGAIEIFEMPIYGGEGKPISNRYIAGIDPYDDDASTTSSLGSIFIFDMITDRIVAEYTGRPLTANEFYENCARLLLFYNARANYENDKKGLFAYFTQKHLQYLLVDTPEILKDMDMVKGNLYGNKAKGTNSGKMINAWGRRLQADWMNTPAVTQTSLYEQLQESASMDVENLEEQEEQKEVQMLNLHYIRSFGYLKEAIAYNDDGNFDRVSAMGMLMILREEYRKYKYNLDEKSTSNKSVEDPFFTKNWDSKMGLQEDIFENTTDNLGFNSGNGTFYKKNLM